MGKEAIKAKNNTVLVACYFNAKLLLIAIRTALGINFVPYCFRKYQNIFPFI